MTSVWLRVGVAFLIAFAAAGSWGSDRAGPQGSARYSHTRCIILARLAGPYGLAELNQEVRYLRSLGAPEIVVVIAGISDWQDINDSGRRAAEQLRQSADRVLPEWRSGRAPPKWLDALGTPVPSALMESAYWQDRGYRLLPYEPRDPEAAPHPTQAPAPTESGTSSEPRLRFSW